MTQTAFSTNELAVAQQVLSGNEASGEYAPLTVKDGVVVLKAGGSNRISMFSRYRRNFIAEQVRLGRTGRTVERLLEKTTAIGKKLYQLHHMIPDNAAQSHPLVREALQRLKGYTVDRGSNMYAMPTKQVPGNPYGHLGSHPIYDAWAIQKLARVLAELTQERALPLKQVGADAIDGALRKVETEISRDFINKALPSNVVKEMEGGGFKLTQVEQDGRQAGVMA